MRSYHSLLSSVVSEHIFTENSIDFSPILMKGFFSKSFISKAAAVLMEK